MTVKTLTILGSTGSIGNSTLEVVREANAKNGEKYEVIALTANSAALDLINQAKEFRPKFVAIRDDTNRQQIDSALLPLGIKTAYGEAAINEAAEMDSDLLMASIVGAAGLKPTLKAVERGAQILLANKECLVSAGQVFLNAAIKSGSKILPVDSEHNAIFQVLENSDKVEKLILTASGGPFWNTPLEALKTVTPQQAIKHPNWQMGAKISVDSATMANKGLELIEASLLFQMPQEKIDVLVHPQSIIHSLVSYVDGSVLAQLGTPDMRVPISYCMAYPNRQEISAARLNLAQIGNLEFFEPDNSRFKALSLARETLRIGGAMSNIFNAANEIAVAAFLNESIGFMDIITMVEKTLEKMGTEFAGIKPDSLEDVEFIDNKARQTCAAFLR